MSSNRTFLALRLLGFGTITLFYFSPTAILHEHSGWTKCVSGIHSTQSLLMDWPRALFRHGFAIVRAWSVPVGVWIALLVTGLIPAGCLTLFLVLVHTLKRASESVTLGK